MDPGISLIPEEILAGIFKHLCIRDKKHARLTCSLWYRECSHFSIIKNEKFVFRKRNSSGYVSGTQFLGADFFQRCARWRNHWEFHGLPLINVPFPWQSRGALVEALFIYNCNFDELTFAKIIFHCTNLIRFRLANDARNHCASSAEDMFGALNFHTPLIDQMVKTGIKREKLITFELYSHTENEGVISKAMYQKILKIFPNIRTFGHGDGSDWNTLYSQRYTLADNNQNLLGEWPFPPDNMLESWILPTLKFTEFKILFNDRCKCRADFLHFLDDQTELERIYLDEVKTFPNFERTPILLHALRSLPKLKELWYNCGITVCDGLSLTREEFCELLMGTSKLEAIQLKYIYLYMIFPVPNVQYNLVPSIKYTKLKKLLLGPFVDEIIVFEILSRCSTSLQFLHLDLFIDGRIMQKIFEIHTDLQNLFIRGFERLPSSELTLNNSGDLSEQKIMKKFSFSRLQNLKHLEIKYITSVDMHELLMEFNAPNLQCYHFPEMLVLSSESAAIQMEERHHIIDRTFRTLLEKGPRLKVLCFHGRIPMSTTKLIKYCKQLRKLEIIFLNCGKRSYLKSWVTRNSCRVEKLFTECPSLSWLADNHESKYSYDHSTMNLIEYDDRVCLFTQKYNIWSFGQSLCTPSDEGSSC